MKCPKCERNQKYALGMTCSNCQYKFVLNPKTSGASDYKFYKIDQAVSEEGTKYYTFNQFYNVYANYKGPLLMIILLIAAVIPIVLMALSILNSTAAIILTIILVVLAIGQKPSSLPSKSTVFNNFTTYKNSNPLPFFIGQPNMQNPPANFSAETMIEHGTEGILFVDQDIYVDLFIKNKIHHDLKSIVISQSGYPQYLAEPIAAMYKKHPNIKVYMLHDSHTNTTTMRKKIKVWLGTDEVEIIDLGMDAGAKENIRVFKKYKNEETVHVDYLRSTTLTETLSNAIITGVAMDMAYQSIYGQSRGIIDDFG